MHAASLCTPSTGRGLFPGCFSDEIDTMQIAPGTELYIDPQTYPAVGLYVPDPKGGKVAGTRPSMITGLRDRDPEAHAKKMAHLKRPRVTAPRSVLPRPGMAVSPISKKRSPNLPPLGTDAAPHGKRRSDVMEEDDVHEAAAAPQCPLNSVPYTVSRIVVGPYTADTGYGTVLTSIYYPPPKPKEIGLPAEEINALIHKPDQLATKEVRVQESNPRKALLYKIGPGAVAFRVVLNTFDNAGMRHTAGENWNILWAKRIDPSVWGNMGYYTRVNHFPGTWGIGRKDQLHKNVQRFRKTFGAAFDITPQSWVLPQDTKQLGADMMAHPGTTYILKPCASSCGKGIRLITKLPQNKIKSSVVQRYIPNPFLVEQRKFDLRIYVAVTGFDPLRIYIFDEGLCRFAAEKYPGAGAELGNSYAHLTNYSISKTAILKKDEKDAASEADGPKDIKWMLSELKAYLLARGEEGFSQWQSVRKQVQDVIIKTFITVETDVCNATLKNCKYPNGHGCFELFGFDLMVDTNMKVYVLEANIMPSLATGNPLDKAVKNRLLSHLITLVGVVPHDRETAKQEEDKGTMNWSAREANRTCKYINGKVPTGAKRARDQKAFFDTLTDNDKRLIVEAEEELHRAQGFYRVFPTKNTWERYAQYFDVTRYRNELLARWEAEKEADVARQMDSGAPPPVDSDWDVPVPQAKVQ